MSKLPKAPLQEAIFEMRWPLQPDVGGRQLIDPEYAFALGKFQDALKDTFPHHVAKFPGEVPYQLLNYQTIHQFWQHGKQWPVVQLGPGIAAVNDTEQNCEWNKTYLPNIEKTLNALQKSYGQLVFNSLSLRYIDVVRVAEYGKESWEAFVQEHINFSFHNQFDTRRDVSKAEAHRATFSQLGQLPGGGSVSDGYCQRPQFSDRQSCAGIALLFPRSRSKWRGHDRVPTIRKSR